MFGGESHGKCGLHGHGRVSECSNHAGAMVRFILLASIVPLCFTKQPVLPLLDCFLIFKGDPSYLVFDVSILHSIFYFKGIQMFVV